MAIITLPQAVADSIGSMTWGQSRFDRQDVSAVTGAAIVNAGAPPRWTVRLASKQAMDLALAGQWEATLLQLRGGINHLALYDRQRPVPGGSARGTGLVTTATVAAGATTVPLAGARAEPNQLFHPYAFGNAYWIKAGATVVPTSTLWPTGDTFVIDKLTEDGSNGLHMVASPQNLPAVAGQVYTYSCFVKAAGRNRGVLYLDAPGFGGTYPGVDFDLSTGTVTATGGPLQVGVNSAGAGWYRVYVTAVATATTSATSWFLQLRNAAGDQFYTGDGSSGVHVWGAQAEPGYLGPLIGYPTLLPGDWLQIGTGVGSHLAKVTQAVTLADSGAGTVTFEPPTRAAYGSGAAVAIERALGHFRAAGDTLQWQASPNGPSVQGFAWDGVEAWT